MKKFISASVIPIILYVLVLFGVYHLVIFNMGRIKNDPTNFSYATMRERDVALLCLTDNIYYEANNQNAEGKIAVAQVTLNRVASGKFGKGVCGVVYSHAQFSWTLEMPKTLRAKNMEAYNESKEVAKRVLLEGYRLPSIKTALWYHADYVNPAWAKEKTKLIKIGRHIFYA